MARSNLVETVLHACRGDALVASGGRLIVAFSGGPDSSALLHALSRVAPRLGLQLTAAHLDHAMRPGSTRAAARAARFCQVLGLELVRGTAGAHISSEGAARTARYRFLEGVAADRGAHTIALGHTADDQAETVLLHLARGAGLQGLAAMAPREGTRFRPLLTVTRQEVERYCERRGLKPVHDPTNRDPKIPRNRVRRRLLPEMEKLNPRIRASLCRLADAARAEHEVVAEAAERWLDGQGPGLDRVSFAQLAPAVQVDVLRSAWATAAGIEPPGGPLAFSRPSL